MPGQSSQVAESELENAGPNAGSRVYVCAGACGGQRSTLGVLLSLSLFLRPGLDSLMIPDLAVAGHPAFGFCLSCFPAWHRDYRRAMFCLILLSGPGD